MKLWLARHAQPLIVSGVCYGATDVAADGQATLVAAQALSRVLPAGVLLRTSTLQRCERLAHSLLALRPDLSCENDDRLVEMNFGLWEGQRWDAISRPELECWTHDFGQHACGGGESVDQFMGRVTTVWDEARALSQDTVWITHAGVIRAAMLLSQGVRQVSHAHEWPQQAPGFGEWYALDV